MGIKKLFGRSYAKLQSSPTSFSSNSFSSSSSAEDVGNSNSNSDSNNNFNSNSHGDTGISGGWHQRRPSRWKRSSSQTSPKHSPGGSTSTSKQRTPETPGQRDSNKSRSRPKPNRNKDPATAGFPKNLPPPWALLSASSELLRAITYFEITTAEGFTREFVKKKYKRLSLIHHPDRNGNEETSIREMQTINHYFDLLQETLDRLEETTSETEIDVETSNENYGHDIRRRNKHEKDPPVTPGSNENDGKDIGHRNKREKDPPVTPSSSSNRRASENSGGGNKEKRQNQNFKDKHTNSRLRSTPRRKSSPTSNEKEKGRKRAKSSPSTSRHRKQACRTERPVHVPDLLFDVFLCFLVGKYVTVSGWIASPVILALAYFAEDGVGDRKGKSASGSTTSATTPIAFATTTRIPKTIFFALHTGWYLLVGILSRGRDLVATLGDRIPLPWQLLGVAAAIPCFVQWMQNHEHSHKHKLQHQRFLLLRYIAYATIRVESVLIAGFDWILSRNAEFASAVAPENLYSNSRGSIQIQTVADFAVMSISFLTVQFLCGDLHFAHEGSQKYTHENIANQLSFFPSGVR